jgi:hypothetical protein
MVSVGPGNTARASSDMAISTASDIRCPDSEHRFSHGQPLDCAGLSQADPHRRGLTCPSYAKTAVASGRSRYENEQPCFPPGSAPAYIHLSVIT